MKSFEEIAVPAGLMASLIIGAGIFSLPFVFIRAGFFIGFSYLLAFTFLSVRIHRMYATIVLKDEGVRFSGYVKKYLGGRTFWFSNIVSIGGSLLTMLVYIVLSAGFLKALIPAAPESFLVFFYWILSSVIIALGVMKFASLDLIFLTLMIVISLGVLGFGLYSGNFWLIRQSTFDLSNLVLPMGPIIFALSGRAAISSLRDYYEAKRINPKWIYKAVGWGTIIPAMVYVAFILGIVLLSNKGVSADALSGLTYLPRFALIGINLFGITAIITSHVFLGIETKLILRNDLKLSALSALAIVSGLPIIFYLLGFDNFITIVSVVGGIFLAAENILVILMYESMTGKRKWFDLVLISVFVAGIVYELLKIAR